MTNNIWTQLSIDLANQRNYLDELFKVYPMAAEMTRDISSAKWNKVEDAFEKKDNIELVKSLLKLDLFPIKDSYVAYLKRDNSSIERNPNTINRLSGKLYEMGMAKILDRSSQPKETNRQIGPMFRNWYRKGSLGMTLATDISIFNSSNENMILDLSDEQLKKYAKQYLNYETEKGIDLICKVNSKVVIAEAKFLSDFGGHQNSQFSDAVGLIKSETAKGVVKIAILDGVLYIKPNNGVGNKMYKRMIELSNDYNIMSSLVLREFLYQL